VIDITRHLVMIFKQENYHTILILSIINDSVYILVALQGIMRGSLLIVEGTNANEAV